MLADRVRQFANDWRDTIGIERRMDLIEAAEGLIRMKQALKFYGRHSPDCPGGTTCRCGLTFYIEQLGEARKR